jgi:hypothetical protein
VLLEQFGSPGRTPLRCCHVRRLSDACFAILCCSADTRNENAPRPREAANALRRAPDLSKPSACMSSADLQTSPRTQCGVRSDRSHCELTHGNPPTAGLGRGKYSSAVPISHWLPNSHDFPTRLLGVLLASTTHEPDLHSTPNLPCATHCSSVD